MWRDWLPEDRTLRVGLYVSGGAHLALILWALLGGIFFTPEPNPETVATSVSLMSTDEFAAIEARAPTAPEESPAQPSAPETSVKPPARPQPETPPEETAAAEPIEEPAPETPPEVEEPPPAETVVTDAAPSETLSPTPDSLSQIPDTPTDTPQPDAAEIVAPQPTPDPPPEAETSTETAEATTDAPAEEPQPEEPTEATVPQDTGEVLETEENKDQEPQSAAPRTSPVPPKRPDAPKEPEPAPAPQETEVASAETAPAPDESVNADDAVAEALAQELAGAASDTPEAGTGAADQGPPLNSGELEAIKVDVNRCWNLGAVSTDATRAVVTVLVTFTEDTKPASVELLSSEGPDAAVQTAFQAARRAILRCGADGYPMPADKFETWKEIEMVFENTKGIR